MNKTEKKYFELIWPNGAPYFLTRGKEYTSVAQAKKDLETVLAGAKAGGYKLPKKLLLMDVVETQEFDEFGILKSHSVNKKASTLLYIGETEEVH